MRNRTGLFVLVSFLSGALGAALVLFLAGTLRIPSFPFPSLPSLVPAARKPATPVAQRTPAQETPAQEPAVAQVPTATIQFDAARGKLVAGRLEEAQDDFLQILLTSDARTDPRVMQGLVTVRRQLARDDPAALRRQAAAYRQAIVQHVDTQEGYTPEAMELLAAASLLAADDLEAKRLGKPLPRDTGGTSSIPTGPRVAQARPPRESVQGRRLPSNSSGDPVRRRPQQASPTPVSPNPPLQALPATRPPEAAAASPPPTPASAPARDENEPFLLVQVGPVASQELAAEIAGELTLGGFVPHTSRREEPSRFQVVTEPLPRTIADRRAAVLAQQGLRPSVRALTGGLAQLDFGAFPSGEAAEAVAKRVRTLGFSAIVAREGGTVYIITLGPYRQSAVESIARLISRFKAAVTVSPAP